MSKSNEYRTGQTIPAAILKAIDHVREFFPVVDMVVFNASGRWQFMGEDFERDEFGGFDPKTGRYGGIDVSILQEASDEAYNVAGHPSVFQAYTSDKADDDFSKFLGVSEDAIKAAIENLYKEWEDVANLAIKAIDLNDVLTTKERECLEIEATARLRATIAKVLATPYGEKEGDVQLPESVCGDGSIAVQTPSEGDAQESGEDTCSVCDTPFPPGTLDDITEAGFDLICPACKAAKETRP